MKKTILVIVIALVAVGIFTGVAAAQGNQSQTGPLHEYMEKALAQKLGIAETAVESQVAAGERLYQIALDNGITQANLPAFMLEVRTNAIKAALADGVISQAWADWMFQSRGHGMGYGRMGSSANEGRGVGPCGGTGVPIGGGGMRMGGRWQQGNP